MSEAAATPPSATGRVEVEASAEATYAVITDLDAMAAHAEEAVAMQWTRGDRATPGAVFRGRNRNGWRRWSTTCTVTDAEPGRRFAFEVTSVGGLPVARWQYDLEPLGEGRCRVVESTWDKRPGWFVAPAGLATGVKDRTGASHDHIAATLERLRAHAEA